MSLLPLLLAVVVEWAFPLTDTCHEGLAFADGTTGVLVWGGGDEIRLTVGRGDLWDHRGGSSWSDEQSYSNIVSLVRQGRGDRLKGLFRVDEPANWGGRKNPTLLPLGRGANGDRPQWWGCSGGVGCGGGFGGFVMVDPSVRRLRVRLPVG